MNKHHPDTHRQRGLTLVELMIGLMVGMLVIGAVLYVFLGSRLTYKYNDTMGRLQENGRVAIEMISQDLRMAGFIGCRRLEAYLSADAINGLENGSAFNTAIAAKIGLPANSLNLKETGFIFSQILDDQLADTDSLTVLSASASIPLEADTPPGAISTDTVDAVPAGPAIVSNCQLEGEEGSPTLNMSSREQQVGTPWPAHAFVVTEAGTTITHPPFDVSYSANATTTVTPITLVTYAIRFTNRRDSTGNLIPALFRNEIELVEGARDFCVRYGIAANSNNEAVGEYIDSPTGDELKQAIAIRVELLLSSIDDNIVEKYAAVPTLCDRPIPEENDLVLDHRMYKIFTATVGLRNQVRQP